MSEQTSAWENKNQKAASSAPFGGYGSCVHWLEFSQAVFSHSYGWQTSVWETKIKNCCPASAGRQAWLERLRQLSATNHDQCQKSA